VLCRSLSRVGDALGAAPREGAPPFGLGSVAAGIDRLTALRGERAAALRRTGAAARAAVEAEADERSRLVGRVTGAPVFKSDAVAFV
jgi:hypothetical protein